jgi:hypothetical protein
MDFEIFDDNPSFKLTATSIQQGYNIVGADGMSAAAVTMALLNYAPATNAPPGSNYVWPISAVTMDEVEATTGTWHATITWSSLNYQVAWKVGGQQQQVRADISIYQPYGAQIPTAFAAAAKGQPIGWDGRNVHGCSIYVPQLDWTESVEIPAYQFTPDYVDNVFAVAMAPVNGQSYRGYEYGSVLFKGMQSQLSTKNPNFVSAAFEFSMSPNYGTPAGQPALTVGSITGIVKQGWDYLDPFFTPQVDNGANRVIPQPQYVLIHTVYNRSNFANLNIGTDQNLPLWQG